MKRPFILIASTALGFATFALSPAAHALGPVDLEVGAKVGGATNPISTSGAPNPLGFGLGARAGISFLGGIYAGANLMYYIGSSQSVDNISYSYNTLMVGGELGYGIKILDLLTIRPQVGLGNAGFTGSASGVSSTNSYYYLEPGVTGLIGLGLFFVGADANALFFPSAPNSQAAFSIHAQVGVKF